jgi:hypothetical protein
VDDSSAYRRATNGAAAALLGFSAFTGFSLVAWFARAESPVTWKSVVAMFSVVFGMTIAALVWRAPSRAHVGAGICIMLFSLVRLGLPVSGDWTWASYALIAVTTLLVIPLVHALIILPPNGT